MSDAWPGEGSSSSWPQGFCLLRPELLHGATSESGQPFFNSGLFPSSSVLHQQADLSQQQPLHLHVQAANVIFLCDPRTEQECVQRRLLGLPRSQAQVVREIVPEISLLFLFNVRTRLLFGVFRASSWPQLNLEPDAWSDEGGGSRYPLQVRVRLEFHAVLQLPEERFRRILDYRGSFNRFDMRLSAAQAGELVDCFRAYGQPRQAGLPPPRPPADPHGLTGAQRTARAVRNALIFICDTNTEEECLSRRLLGLPKSQVSLLSKLTDTSRLFLFNVRTRLMMGVMQPSGAAGLDLEPDAWGGRFPVQVRYRVAAPHTQVLSLPESALGEILRYRSTSARFDLLLRGRALERLLAMFAQHGTPLFSPSLASSAQHAIQPHGQPMHAQPVHLPSMHLQQHLTPNPEAGYPLFMPQQRFLESHIHEHGSNVQTGPTHGSSHVPVGAGGQASSPLPSGLPHFHQPPDQCQCAATVGQTSAEPLRPEPSAAARGSPPPQAAPTSAPTATSPCSREEGSVLSQFSNMLGSLPLPEEPPGR
uniref:DCD domain-containing protein n=1 Tax=Chrysotila carterae TaxID=13221 RepID=A0A7S4B0C0_CHRCT